MQELINRAKELLNEGKVTQVLGWKKGDLTYNPEPAYFKQVAELDNFTYDGFCSANLSKYLTRITEPTLVFLRPCDTYSFNQLLKEHRLERKNVYIIGVACQGTLDLDLIKNRTSNSILAIANATTPTLTVTTLQAEKNIPYQEVLLERCRVCKGKEHLIADEIIGESKETRDLDRFEAVAEIEQMEPEARFAYFQKILSSCIRCNACRNVCPACNCVKCVFNSPKFDSEQKANVATFEEKMFHIIRSLHVAGRCSDCGECSRVCPQKIPLQLFNRKLIKDINTLYGDFQAGMDTETKGPLTNFTLEDPEPNTVRKGGV